MAMSTSTHVAAVLQSMAFSFAAMRAALLKGRVAMNGARPYESLTDGFALATAAAVNAAMNAGVINTPRRTRKTSANEVQAAQSSTRTNGRSMEDPHGRDKQCPSPTSHAC